MDSSVVFFLHSFAGLLAIMDPIGAIPIFLALTPDHRREEIRRDVLVATVTAGITLLLFALAGHRILQFFGISIAAFKASGGILLLLMALQMMEGQGRKSKSTPEEQEVAQVKESIAIVPLGIPLLAGPGTMSTILLMSERAESLKLHVTLFAAMAAVIVVVYLSLSASALIRRAIGDIGIRVATRIMGLVVAAIAVQFIADGLLELFPGLGQVVSSGITL